MRMSMKAIIIAATAAALAGPAAASGAAASDMDGYDKAGTHLKLSITPQGGKGTDKVTLKCDPAGGSHPDPEAACASLADVDGEFVDLPSTGEACTLEYAPVSVRATGTWEGDPVNYSGEFTNRCIAGVETDGVFDF